MKKLLILGIILTLVLVSSATAKKDPFLLMQGNVFISPSGLSGGSGVYENLSIDSVDLTIDSANVRTEQ